jgi:hypothetical protein
VTLLIVTYILLYLTLEAKQHPQDSTRELHERRTSQCASLQLGHKTCELLLMPLQFKQPAYDNNNIEASAYSKQQPPGRTVERSGPGVLCNGFLLTKSPG